MLTGTQPSAVWLLQQPWREGGTRSPATFAGCNVAASRANSPSSKRVVPRTQGNYLGVKALSKIEAQVTEEVCLLISELGGFKRGDMKGRLEVATKRNKAASYGTVH